MIPFHHGTTAPLLSSEVGLPGCLSDGTHLKSFCLWHLHLSSEAGDILDLATTWDFHVAIQPCLGALLLPGILQMHGVFPHTFNGPTSSGSITLLRHWSLESTGTTVPRKQPLFLARSGHRWLRATSQSMQMVPRHLLPTVTGLYPGCHTLALLPQATAQVGMEVVVVFLQLPR